MSREVDDFFDEIETKIPEDVSRLVEKQMDIADAIADAIENSEFKTRKEFAQAIGMKESMLSRILAGNVNLTLKTIAKIEAALEMDIISVAGFEAEKGPVKIAHGGIL
ncbi:MAG: helix-turn-helix transcriptional regulator [Candidatus Marinimicrobia bacterium]|nr:helix-turn-helix transcriptional regulator [bacterium]MCG2715999.1 helix-turn-helix transcriptional regulator [Candidatus Neomarinimicrobiota bacterium]